MLANENAPQGQLRGVDTDAPVGSAPPENPTPATPFVHLWRNAVWNSDLSAGAKLALFALSLFGNADGENCFPAADTLAPLCSCDEKTIRRKLDAGREAGWVERHGRKSVEGYAKFVYRLRMPAGANIDHPNRTRGPDKLPEPVGPGKSSEPEIRSGHSVPQVRTIDPLGPDKLPDDLCLDLVEASCKSNSSLRSDSSSAIAADPPPDQGEKPEAKKPALTLVSPGDKSAQKAERLRQLTLDAVEAYNAKLGKPNGLLPSVNLRVGLHKRVKQIERCKRVAREICAELFDSQVITREFWDAYFEACSLDDFKSGRKGGGPGHEDWLSSFEYLTREKTMLDVFDKATSRDAA